MVILIIDILLHAMQPIVSFRETGICAGQRISFLTLLKVHENAVLVSRSLLVPHTVGLLPY